MRRGTDDAVKGGLGEQEGTGGERRESHLDLWGERMVGRMWRGKGEQKDAEMDGGQVGGKAEEDDVCLCHSSSLMASSENPPVGKVRQPQNPLVIKHKTDFTSFLSVILFSGMSVGLLRYYILTTGISGLNISQY